MSQQSNERQSSRRTTGKGAPVPRSFGDRRTLTRARTTANHKPSTNKEQVDASAATTGEGAECQSKDTSQGQQRPQQPPVPSLNLNGDPLDPVSDDLLSKVDGTQSWAEQAEGIVEEPDTLSPTKRWPMRRRTSDPKPDAEAERTANEAADSLLNAFKSKAGW
ncbi:hypothetical protein LTR09_002979 [Extremus antarcticus]|uniref:Uncharacterized protein n=1 Tax=Extremus antarcticus TaxID=702011 RepID=A0AAJ0GFD6_9PEZI|nr:hypothetical protein LTR09_002979 [Extremus antarcticus]